MMLRVKEEISSGIYKSYLILSVSRSLHLLSQFHATSLYLAPSLYNTSNCTLVLTQTKYPVSKSRRKYIPINNRSIEKVLLVFMVSFVVARGLSLLFYTLYIV